MLNFLFIFKDVKLFLNQMTKQDPLWVYLEVVLKNNLLFVRTKLYLIIKNNKIWTIKIRENRFYKEFFLFLKIIKNLVIFK